MPEKKVMPKPAEVGAVWTEPNSSPDSAATAKIHGGRFLVGPAGIVDQPVSGVRAEAVTKAAQAVAPPAQARAAQPGQPWKPEAEKKQ